MGPKTTSGKLPYIYLVPKGNIGTNETMEMIVEMMEKIPGLQYTPMWSA